MGLKSNISDVRRQLQRTAANVERFAERELQDAMDSIFADTQVKVPRNTGALAASGDLKQTGHLEWTIKYGNSNVDRVGVFYAAAVHNRSARHAPPTGEKYVEEPLMQGVPKLEAATIRAIRRALK